MSYESDDPRRTQKSSTPNIPPDLAQNSNSVAVQFLNQTAALNEPPWQTAAEASMEILEEHCGWLWVRDALGEHPIYQDPALEARTEGYFALTEQRPDLFAQSPHLPLTLDRKAMLGFSQRTGMEMGLVFDNVLKRPDGTLGRRFYSVVRDLVDGCMAYARVLYPDIRGNGTVMIPRLCQEKGEPLFGLLNVYRHTIRSLSGGEFPRGFLEPSLTPEENAARELQEEMGIEPAQIRSLKCLGNSRPDTGLTSGAGQIYLVDLQGPVPPVKTMVEAIVKVEWLPLVEMERRVLAGEVQDGWTLSALLLYKLQEERKQK